MRGREVVLEESAGEGRDEGGRRAKAGLVGILEADAKVREPGGAMRGGRCSGTGLRVVVVVGEDGDGNGADGRRGQDGRDVGQGVPQRGFYKGVPRWRGR